MFDWSDGEYELTAAALEPVAVRVLDAIGPVADLQLLDLGCGTGNAALIAARRGARVTAIDPAVRLLDVVQTRAATEELSINVCEGDACALPFDDASFDLAVSVFAVIFAPDPRAAATELVRVLRPGGRAVIAAWIDEGAISDVGKMLVTALLAKAPPANPPPAPRPRWGALENVRTLFGGLGVELSFETSTAAFTAASPTAWFDEQESHHPAWRFGRSTLGDAWPTLRACSIARLADGNEEPNAFRTTSPYRIVTVRRT